jgi:triacylglycerol esterase/lipase EstA (alpha/beta hydrolase family)
MYRIRTQNPAPFGTGLIRFQFLPNNVDCTEPTPTRRSVLKGTAATGAAALGLSTVGTAAASDASPDELVLLVNGYADTEDTPWWDILESHFEDVGYAEEDIHRLDIGDIPGTTVDSPTEYADLVKQRLAAISDDHGSEVDIVAHSMGGLDSRWAIEKQDAARYVDDLVTLGTPHQGTRVAYLDVVTPAGRDLDPGSDFLTELNDGQLAESVDYLALWSHGDQLINPDEYAKIPHPEADSVDTTRNDNTGYEQHIELVYDRDVFEQYVQFLD